MSDVTSLSKRVANKKRNGLSRPMEVAESIKAFVIEERLKPGDRLPNEAQLIEKYQMAKGTIREATRILEVQGLVRTRTGPGGGCFVHDVSENRAMALLTNFFHFKDMSIKQIYQIRKILEPEVAAELTGKLDVEEIEELHKILSTYSVSPKTLEDEKAHHIAALKFHEKLAEFSKNALLSFIIKFMIKVLSETTINKKLYDPINIPLWEKGREYQHKLINSIEGNSPDVSRSIIYDHMCFAEQHMKEQEIVFKNSFLNIE